MLADLLKIPSTSRANIRKKLLNIGLVNTFLWARGASQKKRNYKRDVIGTLRLTIPIYYTITSTTCLMEFQTAVQQLNDHDCSTRTVPPPERVISPSWGVALNNIMCWVPLRVTLGKYVFCWVGKIMYHKWPNKRPLPSKRLLSNRHPL